MGDPEQLMQIRIPLFTLTRIWISIVLIYIFKIHIFFRIKSSYPRTKSSYPIGRNHPIFQIISIPPSNDLWRIGPWRQALNCATLAFEQSKKVESIPALFMAMSLFCQHRRYNTGSCVHRSAACWVCKCTLGSGSSLSASQRTS